MDLPVSVNSLGALITFGLGIFGLFWPESAARMVALQPEGERGISEMRATFGGLFVAVGFFALLAQDTTAFRTLGVAWIGAAAGRSFSYVRDESTSGSNLGAIVVELVVGVMLLVPWNALAGN